MYVPMDSHVRGTMLEHCQMHAEAVQRNAQTFTVTFQSGKPFFGERILTYFVLVCFLVYVCFFCSSVVFLWFLVDWIDK